MGVALMQNSLSAGSHVCCVASPGADGGLSVEHFLPCHDASASGARLTVQCPPPSMCGARRS